MTCALCLNCGEIKVGALLPCRECGAPATGNEELNITFSDHVFTHPTILAFGTVIKAIGRIVADDEVRFWTFIRFLSLNHPDILQVEFSEAEVKKFDELLAIASMPRLKVVRSKVRR